MPETNDHAFDFTSFVEDKASWPAPTELIPYTCRDGSILACRHYIPEPHQEPGDPRGASCNEVHIILLHGSSSDSRYLAFLATQLTTMGRHVHTPDLRGHGPSPLRRGDIDHPLQLEEDLEDLIASLALPENATLFVAGHSAGGGLALRASAGIIRRDATEIPLSGVILLAPYLHHMAPNIRRESTWASPKVARILLCSLLAKIGIHSLDHLTVLTFNIPDQYRDANMTAAYSWCMMTGLNPLHYQRDLKILAKYDIPLMALIGENDEAFLAEKLGDCLLPYHGDSQLILLDDIDHLGIATAPITARYIDIWLAKK